MLQGIFLRPKYFHLLSQWLERLVPFLTDAGLRVAVEEDEHGLQPSVEPVTGGRKGRHGAELTELLSAMQGLYQSEPDASW